MMFSEMDAEELGMSAKVTGGRSVQWQGLRCWS